MLHQNYEETGDPTKAGVEPKQETKEVKVADGTMYVLNDTPTLAAPEADGTSEQPKEAQALPSAAGESAAAPGAKGLRVPPEVYRIFMLLEARAIQRSRNAQEAAGFFFPASFARWKNLLYKNVRVRMHKYLMKKKAAATRAWWKFDNEEAMNGSHLSK